MLRRIRLFVKRTLVAGLNWAERAHEKAEGILVYLYPLLVLAALSCVAVVVLVQSLRK